MHKRVLVTGGAGFIGRHVVNCLLSRGIEAVAFDRYFEHTTEDEDFPALLGDVKDKSQIKMALTGCTGVIHLAAVLGTQETIDHSLEVAQNNLKASMNIFELCKELRIPGVFIAVGNHWMLNPYSITKTAAEDLALFYNEEFHTRIAVVRAMNAFGEGQKAWPVKKMIPNFMTSAIRNQPLDIYGSGNQVADLIYVKDLAEILVAALIEDHGIYDRVFEAGLGLNLTVNEIAKQIVKFANSESIENRLPLRPGEEPDAIIRASEEKIHELPIHSGFTPLDESIKNTLDWYRKNLDEVVW